MNEQLEVAQTIYEYMGKLKLAVLSSVESFHEGKMGIAYELLSEISKGLDWMINALELTKEVHHIEALGLRDTIEEILEALENEDTVLIADLLEYEIAEKLEEWEESLKNAIA